MYGVNKKGEEVKYLPPHIQFPNLPSHEICVSTPRKVILKEFYAVSDGYKKVLTENDSYVFTDEQKIWDPSEFSYFNLFINGVLQPKINYEVKEGSITLKTDDVPIKGSPIILQMIKC